MLYMIACHCFKILRLESAWHAIVTATYLYDFQLYVWTCPPSAYWNILCSCQQCQVWEAVCIQEGLYPNLHWTLTDVWAGALLHAQPRIILVLGSKIRHLLGSATDEALLSKSQAVQGSESWVWWAQVLCSNYSRIIYLSLTNPQPGSHLDSWIWINGMNWFNYESILWNHDFW
jgi:hypothetical protein